jgi:simple sugar transport system permease protein
LASLAFRANQIVSSIALNLLAAGLTGTLLNHVFRIYGTSPPVSKLPTLGNWLPRLGESGVFPAGGLGSLSVLTPCAFLAALAVWYFVLHTTWGLSIRACGENPLAASSTGLKVSWIRFGAVTAGGVFAGAGGACLSIGELGHFVERMTQGRGYLAVAALILGRWMPGGAVASVLLFGFAEALSQWLAVRWTQWPPQVFLAFPYAVSLMVLFFRRGRHGPPSALGRLS